jgi:hypothetical protein
VAEELTMCVVGGVRARELVLRPYVEGLLYTGMPVGALNIQTQAVQSRLRVETLHSHIR